MTQTEDFYHMLNLKPQDTLEVIRKSLQEKLKQALEQQANPEQQDEGKRLYKLVKSAAPHFKTHEARVAYDAKLQIINPDLFAGMPAPSAEASEPVLVVETKATVFENGTKEETAEPSSTAMPEPSPPEPAPVATVVPEPAPVAPVVPEPVPVATVVPEPVPVAPMLDEADASPGSVSAAQSGKPVDDYYEKFDLDPSQSLEAVRAFLDEKRKEARKLAKVTARREEASILQEAVVAALAVFKDEASRAAYDGRLKAVREAKEAKGMLVDADYYKIIGVTPVASLDVITRRLKSLEEQPDMAEKVEIIRGVLLDAEKKREYDQQLAVKKASDIRKASLTPMPLRLGYLEVAGLVELETTIDNHPQEGLEGFLDGEIAGWIEWGLGKRSTASTIRLLAEQARTSDVPFVKLDECLRNFNHTRPLRLFSPGQKPGDKDVPTLHKLEELLPLIEKQNSLVVQRFEDILMWLVQADKGTVLDQLESAGPEGTPAVQIERLAFAIDPALPVPEYIVQGVAENTIDFGQAGKIGTPTRQFTIQQQGRGYLFGRVATPDDWIKLNVDAFEGPTTTVTVSIDRSRMKAGETYTGKIGIRAIDGRAPNTILVVTIYLQTTGDMLRGFQTTIQNGLKQIKDTVSSLFNKQK